MVPFSYSGLSSTSLESGRVFDVRMALCATTAARRPRRVAMQHVRRPMALILTEIDSQKIEYVFR